MEKNIKLFTRMADFAAADWDRLAGDHPVLRHAYLLALEETGCVSPETGWTPQHLAALDGDTLVGALPLYLKDHSYGEFVFDQSWAEAYERHGLHYYPKLVSSVPFTPVSGPRFLSDSAEIRELLLRAAIQLAESSGASSYHCLFPLDVQAEELKAKGLMLRNTVQFHWVNEGHKNFAEFAGAMRHEKRKNLLKERRRLSESGVTYERIKGAGATAADWEFFYECYLHTNFIYQSPIPLTLDFFKSLGRNMPENILLIFALRDGKRIAAAFDLYTKDVFYGRSWGALEYLPGLHFEVCYYQAIEFCLEEGIPKFEGGAQGEHKLARGLLPVTTWSAHWLAHPAFAEAIDDYLKRETAQIGRYVNELEQSNPFKKNSES